MIPGIDVSHWQGQLDWYSLKQSGTKFAFIKASENYKSPSVKIYKDEKFDFNMQSCLDLGIYAGPYHFFRTHVPGKDQAKSFVDIISKYALTLPPVIDLEVSGRYGLALASMVFEFLKTVEELINVKPIIYTRYSFWKSYLWNGQIAKRSNSDFALGYHLWVAHYTSLWPFSFYPFNSWTFWQYSQTGLLPGSKSALDLNLFNGELIDLISLSNSAHPVIN